MNILDFIVIAVITGFVIYCYARGFAVAVLNFCSFIISIFLTNLLYPQASRMIRNVDGIYDGIKQWVTQTIGLENLIHNAGQKAEREFIHNLNLPPFIKQYLIDNNNEVIYQTLNVNTLEEYVSAFIASIIINIIAMIAVFAAAYALMKVIAVAVNILTKLPVIKTVNKIFGAGLGFIEGVFASWIILAVLVWVYAGSTSFPVNELLENSLIAKSFQDMNIISKIAANIF